MNLNMRHQIKKIIPLISLIALVHCTVPKPNSSQLQNLVTTTELGEASREAYRSAKKAKSKKDKLLHANIGIHYAEACLETNPEETLCLYYQVLNTGVYIQNHIPNFQRGLRKMVESCERLITVQPGYENGGCYRVLGNIYAKAPSFSFSSKGVTQDLDLSVEYLRKAIEIAPDYPLNRLFLARSLEEIDDKPGAREQLEAFDKLSHERLDEEYPQWKKERESLAKKLKTTQN